METSARLSRLTSILLLLAATALAGCSGSSGASSSGLDDGGDPNPPTEQPGGDGSDDSADDDPDDTSPDDPADDDPSAPAPDVSLSASATTVPAGDSVMLSWSSENATSCTAGGGWSGSRPVSGSATVGPITQGTTFSLSCSGAGGNAVDMMSVSVLGLVTLEWDPPTQNVDGSPLTDLAGFRIYYGELSGTYTDELDIDDAASTAHEVTLSSGSYYFAMTALDADGNESTYSNEVVKVVN